MRLSLIHIFIVRQLFGQRLVFPFAADGQIAPPGRKRRGFVTIGRDMQFPGDTLGQFAGQFGALFELSLIHI